MSGRLLDDKLGRIRAGKYTPTDFIIADAKDGDMGWGLSAVGPDRDATGRPVGPLRPISVYRDGMRQMADSGLVDIMLMSLSSAEVVLASDTFRKSRVTPAIRLNDATDIWSCRGSSYKGSPSRPFRTVRLDHAKAIADLGLYAVTFHNDVDRDATTLQAYSEFREEANKVGMRYFLEVFNPSVPIDTGDVSLGAFVNDAITRCLAGVAASDRPLFLKIAYNGAAAMEELAGFDPENLVVGVLGGAAGTARDTFELVAQAERYGARVALFGRKIWFAESPIEIVRMMRHVVQGDLKPIEAVDMYHDALVKTGIAPYRSLADDRECTDMLLKRELT